MKLAKAQEILTDRYRNWPFHADPDFEDAIQLGIQAIIWRIDSERSHPELKRFPLPGETQE